MEQNTIIKISQLGCKIGQRYLLKDINWEVKKGEHWTVFGMNGSGKTTLLSIIAGYGEHTHGQLEVFGQPYTSENILDFRKKIGWVSSSFFDKCLSHESVLNIILSGLFGTLGINYKVTDEDVLKAQRILTEIGLYSKIDYPYSLLSKGERQNVLIARALMPNPEMLILDEPCSGLDVYAREHLQSTIKDLALNTDVTIIYVTHYTEDILTIFDQCVLLKSGRTYAKGFTNELFNDEKLSKFLNYPVQIHQHNGSIGVSLEVQSKLKEIISSDGLGG